MLSATKGAYQLPSGPDHRPCLGLGLSFAELLAHKGDSAVRCLRTVAQHAASTRTPLHTACRAFEQGGQEARPTWAGSRPEMSSVGMPPCCKRCTMACVS